jgi:surface antigen
MFRYNKFTAPLFAVALVTAGCQNGGGQPVVSNQAIGGALGAAAGGLLGTQVGSGRGRTAAIIGGAVLGGLVGTAVAARLSPQGQQVVVNTTQQSLSSAPVGQPASWRDPVNPQIYGTVTPTSAPYYVQVPADQYLGPVQSQQAYAPAQPQPYGQPVYNQQQAYAQPQYQRPQAVATSQGIECRDYQTAVFSGGQPETLTGTMCRTGPGQPWRPRNG